MGISLAENLVLARLRNSEATDIYLSFWTGFTQKAGDQDDEASAAAQLLQEAWSILNPKPAKKYEQEKAGVATSSAEIGDSGTIDWPLMGLTLGLYRSVLPMGKSRLQFSLQLTKFVPPGSARIRQSRNDGSQRIR